MKLSNQVYDCLKFIAQILLPAIGTLYFALARIWELPLAEQVVGTITAIDAFLGALLGISSYQYNKEGKIQPPDDEELKEEG
ncbi:MAG: phage holin [Treponema sp.]|nr:phage holin [Treponema sp.]